MYIRPHKNEGPELEPRVCMAYLIQEVRPAEED